MKTTIPKVIVKHFASKRFIAVCGAVALFTIMLYTTKYGPIELATGITMILGSYLTAETIKPSYTLPEPHDQH